MSIEVHVVGLPIRNVRLQTAADELTALAVGRQKSRVFFVNAHCVNVACEDADYAGALARAELRFADGSGIRWAAGREGVALADNVNGTDLFPLLCERAATAGVPIALLGARPGVAERCAAAMQCRFPGLRVAFMHSGYWSQGEEAALIEQINATDAAMLFVAMGVPRQELWIDAHFHDLKPPVVLAVGALFDFYSGDVPRAPALLRRAGMEWCYRLYKEPRRLFRRYVVGNPLFVMRVLRRLKL